MFEEIADKCEKPSSNVVFFKINNNNYFHKNIFCIIWSEEIVFVLTAFNLSVFLASGSFEVEARSSSPL